LNIHNEKWKDDIIFLSRPHILITGLKVYTQALIHSNLFDSKINHHGGLKELTLSEMATTKYKKPFVCAIIEGNNPHVYPMDFTCISHSSQIQTLIIVINLLTTYLLKNTFILQG